jgi:hypothetical protein
MFRNSFITQMTFHFRRNMANYALHNYKHYFRYELAYLGNGATCNGTVSLTTATSMSPQPAVTLEKTKEKVSSSERVQCKGSGACNGEKPNPDNHPQNGEKSCQGHCSKPPVGDSYEQYRWSRCKQPLPLSSMRIKGVPSPPDNVEVSLLSLQVTLLLCVLVSFLAY